jgi:hypothetical protein
MKKNSVSLFLFLTFSFFLSGLQGSFYFLPLPLPHFWFIILTYYSFNKPLLFILVANLAQTLMLSSFSSSFLSIPLLTMNAISICFYAYSQRFNSDWKHMSLAAGIGSLAFHLIDWLLVSLQLGLRIPTLLPWISTSLVTLLLAPLIITVLSGLEKRIYYERIDTLENLRI